MVFDPTQPHDDLPYLPPREDLETKAVLKRALTASRAVAELKGAGGLIPDQAILINAIPLQEAKLSSEIENIVTTQDKPQYYRRLRAVTEEGEWEAWLVYMLQGLEETAIWTTGRILAIRDLLGATVDRCRREIPKVYSKELVDLIFRLPYCKISFVVDAGIAKRQAASEYLQELERIGVLAGEKRGREVVYRHPALVKVLAE